MSPARTGVVPLVPRLIGPRLNGPLMTSHWSPVSLVPRLIGPPHNVSLVPHLIGPGPQ